MADANSTTNPSGPNTCRAAAVTFVYNESFNLPLWRRHYGAQLGTENLFIVDDGSDDGSTSGLDNVIRLPRTEHDAAKKTNLLASLCRALLLRYDSVICVDCDELVVPDLRKYTGLQDYLARREFDYMGCIGLNVLHLIAAEDPYDPTVPILRQRRLAQFRSSSSKTAIVRKPVTWIPGSHSCDQSPEFDPELYLFHLNQFDYGICARRRALLRKIKFSQRSLDGEMSSHWRYEPSRYFRENFQDQANEAAKCIGEFDFTQEVELMKVRTKLDDGFYVQPMTMSKIVEIPERLRDAF